MKKEYTIFNNSKKIFINENLVQLYEESVAPFHNNRAEYLAVSGGMDENSTEDEITKAVEEGIQEEVQVYNKSDEIIAMAKEQGLIE